MPGTSIHMSRDKDETFMSLALRQAKKAVGMTSPNPLVGAVLVKRGRVIGKGHHKRAGLPHAEIEAFLDAERGGSGVSGSTMYVTLEPCCHTGKRTPPCVNAVIDKKISRVVVGALDPNPKVSGFGVELLRASGIEVETRVLEERCRGMNEDYNKFIVSGVPFVTLKLAATLDGRIAAGSGDSKWIGSEAQRRRAHGLRRRADAVVVGIGTVLTDNPRLTARLGGGVARQPFPVVLDSRLRIPLDAELIRAHDAPVVATTARGAKARKLKRLQDAGVRVLTLESDEEGRPRWDNLLYELGRMGAMNVLVEGGGGVAASALRARAVDKLVWFYAPKIVGGDGLGMVGALGIESIGDSIHVKDIKITRFGDEFMVEGYLS